jgi:hypothetical protein
MLGDMDHSHLKVLVAGGLWTDPMYWNASSPLRAGLSSWPSWHHWAELTREHSLRVAGCGLNSQLFLEAVDVSGAAPLAAIPADTRLPAPRL